MIRFLILILGCAGALPAELSPAGIEFFENKIRPILAQDCYECHRTGGKRKGGLAVDTREGLLRGGDTGPAVISGNPAKSILLQAIRHELPDAEMPKARAKLEDRIIADFEQWIRMGAPDPRDKPPTDEQVAADTNWKAVLARRKGWWSFQPIRRSGPPPGEGHPIDRFIRAKLSEAPLNPAGRADRSILIRRLSFALRGLPPTLSELHSGKSFESLADDFLASPRFGERWARHWMDWFRYADSHGSEGDATIPNAWRYRDYLIRALNKDIGYDQLIREHLAGDVVHRFNPGLGIDEAPIGLAQLRMVYHGFAPTDALEEQVRFVDDEINVISKATLGLTLSCARCHNHKFDPISQADYYGWFGVFASSAPALLDVTARGQDDARARESLKHIKKRLRDQLADVWSQNIPPLSENLKKLASRESTSVPDAIQHWNLADPQGYREWTRDGVSMANVAPAGSFAVALRGDKALTGIFPGGVYSNLATDRDRGVAISPQFKLEGKYDLWVRVAGDGSSAVRYVVHNYPRDGSIYPVNRLTGGGWQWMKFNLDYWEGDRVHIEFATAADLPVMADLNATHSWFGASEALVVKAGSPRPLEPRFLTESEVASPEAFADRVRAAIDAWAKDHASDADALLLDHLLQNKLLSNDLKALPNVQTIVEQYRAQEADLREPTRTPGVILNEPADHPLFVRGNHKQPGEIVPRHFLEAIDNTPFTAPNARVQLADEILRTDNPLAARVIVNRVWHHLFGRGIVATPDNFGRLGAQPSHPELLDFLADWFICENHSSIKGLIRFIITSETWQAASEAPSDAKEKDPENALLSHFSVRRLEAEAIRDAMLAVSGDLNETMYGPPVTGREPRRSVYLRVKRNDLDPFMTAFDAPVPAGPSGKRDVTNVPAQSLMLLNDPFVIDLAQHWGERSGANFAAMFEEAFARLPNETEMQRMQSLVRAFHDDRAAENGERAVLESSMQTNTAEADQLLATARQRVLSKRLPSKQIGPAPIAAWNFSKGLDDQIGQLRLKLSGKARLDGFGLSVDGGFASSEPISMTLKAKTLEAWVRLANLEQRGGGVMTVQDLQGNVFDSIVFGENEAGRWMAGSDFWRRSEGFKGAAEESSDVVHFVIAYAEDGTISGYRNGVPYGMPYKISGPTNFMAGRAQLLFGNRHGSAEGNRPLQGTILQAHLYDRALTAEEVQASFLGDPNIISETELDAALSEAERARFNHVRDSIAKSKESLDALNRKRGLATEAGDLAHALFNLKEFVYVR